MFRKFKLAAPRTCRVGGEDVRKREREHGRKGMDARPLTTRTQAHVWVQSKAIIPYRHTHTRMKEKEDTLQS
jgi:hypothetical protein